MQNAQYRSRQISPPTPSNGAPYWPSGAIQYPAAYQKAGGSVPSKLGMLVVAGIILGFTGPLGGALAEEVLDIFFD